MCLCVWRSPPPCPHSHTDIDSEDANKSWALLEAPGWALWPLGPSTMLSPRIMSGKSPAVCHSLAPLQRESCWGAYVGCDTWLHRHTCTWPCIYTNNNPPYPPTHTPPHTHPQYHLDITTNTQTCMHAHHTVTIYMHTHTHTHTHTHSETRSLTSWSPVRQIAVTPAAHSPSPLRCRANNTIATSWITSSIICIRFDGVKALATI